MKKSSNLRHADHFPSLVENLIIIAIIGVVIHTIFDDLAVIYHWSHDTQVTIAVIGFLFDLFFSVEFVLRSVISHKRNSFSWYIKTQRGWIDFLSSFPLLLLVSGPVVLMYFSGQGGSAVELGFLSILKSSKAIRVTRILRLIRVLKLFGKIQNTDSAMTNRHIGIVSTISTVTMVVVLVITNFVPFTRIGDQGDYLQKRTAELAALTQSAPSREWLQGYLSTSPDNKDVIRMQTTSGKVVYYSPDSAELEWTAYNVPLVVGDFEFRLSSHLAEAEQARANIMMFFAILGLIFSMMFVYAKVFAQEISDPIFVMNKGFRNWDYNLTVKENENFASDEVFRLARAFNLTWLPLKNQIYSRRKKKMEETQKSVLKMDDLF